MTGFTYTYKSSFEIFEEINSLLHYSGIEITILISGIIFITSMVFFIVPYIDVFIKTRKEEKEIQKKRQIMNRIILQKNLEDIIRREINDKKID